MEISVLGPIRVIVNGRALPMPAMQGRLLAILALRASQTVPAEDLIQALWGEDASPTALKTLQTHISQLRRALVGSDEPAGSIAIVTDGRGYRLSAQLGSIDAERFGRLVEAARAMRASDAGGAARTLTAALELWRGPTIADTGEDRAAAAEGHRLEELRAAAVDELARIRLAAGEHEALIPDLRRELAVAPYREKLWSTLLIALARSGRTADALRAYRDAVAALRRELDVDPSPDLEALASRIRRGEESSALEPAHPRVGGDVTTNPHVDDGLSPARGRRLVMGRRQWAVGAVAALLVVALIGTTALLRRPRSVAIGGDSVGRVDESGTLVSGVGVASQPDAIAIGAGDAWVASTADDVVTRVDLDKAATIQRIRVGESPAGLAYGFGAVWVANGGDRTVSRIDPTTDEVVSVIRVGTAPVGVATDERWVWVTNRLDHTISRIDPNDGSTRTFALPSTPLGVATAGGRLWVADYDANAIVEVAPDSGAVRARINVGNGPTGVAAAPAGDAIWVANSRDSTVSRIDVASGIVTTTTSVGGAPNGVSVGGDRVWVAVGSSGEIVTLDATTGQIRSRRRLDASPRAVVAYADGAVFSAGAAEPDHRGGTLKVVSPRAGFPASVDPSSLLADAKVSSLTNDALVAYRMAGGPAGDTLVADLATAIPTSLDDGRTWQVGVRRGVVYSNGAPVRASDVPGSFARALAHGGLLEGNRSVLGSDTCRGSLTCDLSTGITVDDTAGVVTFHLVAPDREFPTLLVAVPLVPNGTPVNPSSLPVPGTGPYVVGRFLAGAELTLVRNTHFHEWSREAKPDGYPDAIQWTASDLPDVSALVETGGADVVVNQSLSAPRLEQLAMKLPSQLHIAPPGRTWFEMMNTRAPPFDDVRVRQAVEYAVDRGALVEAWGGRLAARVTCQTIPPPFSSYEPYCPYTAGPAPEGSWLGPDRARAKALIAAAGVAGGRVTVWGIRDAGGHEAVARYFVRLLNELGFSAQAELLPFEEYFEAITADDVQMAGFWAVTSERNGLDMIRGLFTCPDYPTPIAYIGYPSRYCDRALDEEVTRAFAEETSDPLAATRLVSNIDHRLVDAAPAVMAFNPTDVTFVSGRVGDLIDSPVEGVMLGQLWVQ